MIYHLAEKILYSFEYSPEDQMKNLEEFASINFSIRSSCLPKISLESLGTYDLVQMNKESDFLNEDKKYLEPLIGGMTKDSQKAKKTLASPKEIQFTNQKRNACTWSSFN